MGHEALQRFEARVAVAAMEDYRFWSLRTRYRTSASEFAWLVWPWRVEVAERIAGEADLPNRAAWKAEAARLRARLPELVDRVTREPATWKLAEVLGIPDLARR